ncbi:MAG: hypothetical protein AAGA48_04140 [Myxococcota bacterium]
MVERATLDASKSTLFVRRSMEPCTVARFTAAAVRYGSPSLRRWALFDGAACASTRRINGLPFGLACFVETSDTDGIELSWAGSVAPVRRGANLQTVAVGRLCWSHGRLFDPRDLDAPFDLDTWLDVETLLLECRGISKMMGRSSILELEELLRTSLWTDFPDVAKRIGPPDLEGLRRWPAAGLPAALRDLWTRWGSSTGPLHGDWSFLGPRESAARMVVPEMVPVWSLEGLLAYIDVAGDLGPPGCIVISGQSVLYPSLEDLFEEFNQELDSGYWLFDDDRLTPNLFFSEDATPAFEVYVPAGQTPFGHPIREALRNWPANSLAEGNSQVRRIVRRLLAPCYQPLMVATQRSTGIREDELSVLSDRLQDDGLVMARPLLRQIVRAVGAIMNTRGTAPGSQFIVHG